MSERYKTLANTQNSLAMKFNLSLCQFEASMKPMRGKSLFSIMNVSLVWIDYFWNGCFIIHYGDRLMIHENAMESRGCVKRPLCTYYSLIMDFTSQILYYISWNCCWTQWNRSNANCYSNYIITCRMVVITNSICFIRHDFISLYFFTIDHCIVRISSAL